MAETMPKDDLNRVLIIDDEADVRDLYADIAEGQGFVVATAEDREGFVAAYERLKPTAIILDLTMPEIDGVEILRDLSQRSSEASVILSSGQEQRIVSTAMRLGRMFGLRMQAALQKPVSAPQLEKALKDSKSLLLPITPDRIKTAVEDGELSVFYQPKVSFLGGGGFPVCGAEALVRWNHPGRGMVSPGQFIPIAEDHGLVGLITEFLLEQVISELAAWTLNDWSMPVSVNMSPCQLTDLTLPDRIARQLESAKVDPRLLVLEITEGSAMANVEAATDILTRLRLKNIGVALDDFGAGYSSLSEVYRMPLSELKVDRSLVVDLEHDQQARAVMAGVVALARELDLPVCVEGVETLKTAEYLRSLGCSKGQGFFFSKPLPADQFLAFCAKSRTTSDTDKLRIA